MCIFFTSSRINTLTNFRQAQEMQVLSSKTGVPKVTIRLFEEEGNHSPAQLRTYAKGKTEQNCSPREVRRFIHVPMRTLPHGGRGRRRAFSAYRFSQGSKASVGRMGESPALADALKAALRATQGNVEETGARAQSKRLYLEARIEAERRALRRIEITGADEIALGS
jgi:hypothetical protein